jgi:hypothetical protein
VVVIARVLEPLLCLAAAGALLATVLGRVDADELPLPPASAGRAFDAPAPSPPPAQPESAAAPVEGSGTRADPFRLDFARLAFPDYDPPELRGPGAPPLPLERFPPAGYAGKVVRLEGYMLAVDFADGRVASFVLSRFPPGCCFGATPIFDEWLDARPGPEGVGQRSAYEPIAVTGVLEVGEEVDEEGFVTSLYRLREVEVSELR